MRQIIGVMVLWAVLTMSVAGACPADQVSKGSETLDPLAKWRNADSKLASLLIAAEDGDKAALATLQSKAEHANVGAQYYLAVLFLEGNGVKQDDVKALKWLRRAAGNGSPKAQDELGRMYRNGNTGLVKRNFAAAQRWLHKAAEQGNGDALRNLSEMYGQGQGVKQDFEAAYFWERVAVLVDGELPSPYARESWGTQLTTEQKALVDRRVSAWKGTHPNVKIHSSAQKSGEELYWHKDR
jgi:Sel1 repeat